MDTPMDRDSSIRKLAELIGEIRIAMLTTTTEDGSFRSRPMTTQRAKFDGKLWFFTKRESAKVEEVRRHRRVSLSYAKPEGNSYVSISGAAELISDQKKAQELWDSRYEEWFPQGPSDQSLILIRVTAEQASTGMHRRRYCLWMRDSSCWPPSDGTTRSSIRRSQS